MDLRETKRFGVALDVTVKIIRQDLIRRFREKGIDLTPEQWTLLSELASEESVYQRELAANTFKDAPTVSRIIELLRKRGYIVRNPDKDDRRRFLISLTKEGRRMYEKSAPIVYEARKTGWKGLNDQDYGNLTKVLSKISANITNAH
ncbi:MAG: MarR family winged helix-turn-helix transcriptional regulator [Cyclobacteriaceae bacterium]